MSDGKKKRMSMLDKLAAGTAPEPASMMQTNRALRSARDAVDGHQVWDLDPDQIDDLRVADRLDPRDVLDLQDSIETTGQTVPILVRRHPSEADRYLLVYGRRRLEAIRRSESVQTVRALIANIDETKAVEAQISENMARRDLTFIEKALFAHELVEGGFGSQSKVAEVLTVTKSAVSMAIGIVGAIGPDLIRVIGPAEGVGRPRWQALADAMETCGLDRAELVGFADHFQNMALVQPGFDRIELSPLTFDAVLDHISTEPVSKPAQKGSKAKLTPKRQLAVSGAVVGAVSRPNGKLRLDIPEGEFADWVDEHLSKFIQDLHDRMTKR